MNRKSNTGVVSSNEKEDFNGKRLPHFSYTNKEVLSISKFIRKMEEEMKRVRDLINGRIAGWVQSSRPVGAIYHEDIITEIPGVGAKTRNDLALAGVHKVKDLVCSELTDGETKERLTNISNKSRISIKRLYRLSAVASTALPDSPPPEINHQQADNPYLSRYGEENWEEQIKKVSGMSKYCDIRDLVLHIDRESREAFKGTPFEESYLFYHDALTTMTDDECKEWMESKGILKRRIYPVLGLNDIIVITDSEGNEKTSKHYAGRPVGDCPELMPLDNSLFRDLRCSFDEHVTLTSMAPRTEPRRFSKATPKLIGSVIERLWDPVTGVAPRPNRIVQDILRLKENIMIIVEADGAVVPGVCDRNGHRNKHDGTGHGYHPMHEDQTALGLDQIGLHVDCQQLLDENLGDEWNNFYGLKESEIDQLESL